MPDVFKWENKDEVLAAVRRWPGIFEQELVNTLELVAQKLAGKTADLTPAGTGSGGSLHASIVAERPIPTGKGWRVVYGTSLEHAEVVEYGRSPGSRMPPLEEIARWLWAKGPGLGFDIETEEDADRLAYVVARKIAKKGFSSGPHPGLNGGTAWAMFREAQIALKDEVDADFRDCRERIVRRCNEAVA